MTETLNPKTVIQLFEKVLDKYHASSKKPRRYGTEQLFYHSEVHTIEAIGEHDRMNITQLANCLGVTKSAVSQMIDKLTKKQVVQKTVLSNSDTEVALELTPKGLVVYGAHQEYHRQFYQTVELAMAQVSPSDIRVFGEILNRVAAFLDQEL